MTCLFLSPFFYCVTLKIFKCSYFLNYQSTKKLLKFPRKNTIIRDIKLYVGRVSYKCGGRHLRNKNNLNYYPNKTQYFTH